MIAHDFIRQMSQACPELRLFGGAAVALTSCWDAVYGRPREIRDIDVVTTRTNLRAAIKQLSNIGGHVNKFSLLTSDERLARGEFQGMHVDIYTDPLYLNQKLLIGDRLRLDNYILNSSDLLLTKLQIEERRKLSDIQDVIALIIDTPLSATTDCRAINVGRIAKVCSEAWGFYYSSVHFLTELKNNLNKYQISDKHRIAAIEKIIIILSTIEEYPKPWPWNVRAWFGTAFPHYTKVDP